MFKSVNYTGFVGSPGLRALAERGNMILASEMSEGWHEQVDVTWEAYPERPDGLELALALTLPTGSGQGTRFIPAADFLDEDLLRSRCRSAWDRALGNFLDKRKEAWAEIIREPAGV
jgi:hypothetical protein